ncbi:MAG: hypothetical protein A2945_01500 [Candidatus Liptonbacteria bacterium RIFCSPLOWO2_01_FULL_52_25]|uniref:Uncharacterized protein n=1 Tax=Candidatus Liptonbacteria bacterium RIFCSPLOWO2_01_FULL_52_25 TaxID=1798650 RepID=A0A1G2CDR5_9BACT|nr:MAG: hypothetical protein A2945_01500 [Candidatus Liptonbacteria bacterium RIFCSPLOWO2_01_FULL_52_25]
MKKIINFFIPSLGGVKIQWWHRLCDVLICGSTLLIIIFGTVALSTAIFSYSEWRNYTFAAFSFEPGYESAAGQEVGCDGSGRLFRNCGGITVYVGDKIPTEDQFKKAINTMEAQGKEPHEIQGWLDSFKTFTAKMVTKFDYAKMFGSILVGLFVVIGWFIFWESIIYRTLIYVVYGKK